MSCIFLKHDIFQRNLLFFKFIHISLSHSLDQMVESPLVGPLLWFDTIALVVVSDCASCLICSFIFLSQELQLKRSSLYLRHFQASIFFIYLYMSSTGASLLRSLRAGRNVFFLISPAEAILFLLSQSSCIFQSMSHMCFTQLTEGKNSHFDTN